MHRRLLIKLVTLGVLALGLYTLPATSVSAQKGDECHSSCVTFDGGAPGCASYDNANGSTCGMLFIRGRNVCSQWQCDGLIQ
jgi:hypothetical protein